MSLMRARAASIIVVAAWIVGAIAGFACIPHLHEVAVTDPGSFFPPDSPHRIAREEIEKLFPGASPLSQIVLVIESDSDMSTARDRIAGLADLLRHLQSTSLVSAVLAPTDNPILEHRLVASDSRAALVLVQLSVGFASEEGARVVDEVERLAKEAGEKGFRIFLSGDATLGRDYDRAIDEGGARSAWATIFLVIVILLVVYRSPVAAGVSILTLGAALGATFGLVTLAASLGLSVAYQARSFLVAIVYGVGTDYCLLLFARAREEAAAGSKDPIGAAWRGSLHVIVGSAFAVGVACGLMEFAQFGLFRFSGAALAIGVATALVATLTLAPALMRLLGSHLFWPSRPENARRGWLWPGIARLVLAHPLLMLIVVALSLSPVLYLGTSSRPTFENEIDIPVASPSEAGYAALQRHFSLSSAGPLAVMIRIPAKSGTLPDGWRGPEGLSALHQFTERLAVTPGVAVVHSATRPTGAAGLFERGTIRSQMVEIEAGLRKAVHGAHALGKGLGEARHEVVRGGREIEEKKAALEKDRRGSLAALLAGRRFDDARRDLDGFASDMRKLELGLARGEEGAQALAEGLDRGADRLKIMLNSPEAAKALDRLALSVDDYDAIPELARVMDHFVSEGGEAALFEVELEASPNSPEAVKTLSDLHARFPLWFEIHDLAGATAFVGGPTPITADLEAITTQDLRLVGILVVAGVFILLVLLLGGFALPAAVTVYLLASYFAALGVLSVCARWGIWPGVDWKTPFFLFVLLVAIGADYRIFLLGRARVEAAHSDFEAGLAKALEVTGPVVSSCGLVLAGTFAALALSRVAFLQQVGLGVTAGVLVDTLLVRPFLLPATALLLRKR